MVFCAATGNIVSQSKMRVVFSSTARLGRVAAWLGLGLEVSQLNSGDSQLDAAQIPSLALDTNDSLSSKVEST